MIFGKRSTEEEIERGQRAKRLIEDSMLQEAIQELANGLMEVWQSEQDKAKRDELWRQQRALTDVVNNLLGVMTNGEFVAKKLEVSE